MIGLLAALVASGQVAFEGNRNEVVTIDPEPSTGLKKIFVLHDLQGVTMTYTATTENPVTWYAYGEQGGAYAQPLDDVTADGLVTTLHQVTGNCGYIIYEGTTPNYVWVTDHSAYPLSFTSISADSDGDCNTVTLRVQGQGEEIPYYTITGVRKVLSRDLKLSYDDMEWDDENSWTREPVTDQLESFKPTIVMPAPTCNTTFTLSGDRFMDIWGEGLSVTSDPYATVAVDVRATATQDRTKHDNEKDSGVEGSLGGSAPVLIRFEAFCTEAVIHKEWQMALDPEFNNIQLRLNQDNVEQEFNEAGVTYWRFIGSNVDGSCEAYSETFTVDIGVSELVCPNIFTPGTSEGANDEWKVSYRSIVDFHCWIFNRWGNQIIELTHPSQGWDGRYRGKLVNPGVYYYVLKARGSDGKVYNMSGDINIIRYKDRGGSGSTDPTNPDDPYDDPTGEQ